MSEKIPGAPSFVRPLHKGWETTKLQLHPQQTYSKPGAPSFVRPLHKGWETTELHKTLQSDELLATKNDKFDSICGQWIG
jgi:peptide methionine sulfoxide reductase MsrB